MKTSKDDSDVDIYAYGEKIPPGIHDIHMKQGKVESHTSEIEYGIFFRYRNTDTWEAVFLAFQSQSWCTDEHGHAIKPVKECSYNTDCE